VNSASSHPGRRWHHPRNKGSLMDIDYGLALDFIDDRDGRPLH
jgi:hypothetical protein